MASQGVSGPLAAKLPPVNTRGGSSMSNLLNKSYNTTYSENDNQIRIVPIFPMANHEVSQRLFSSIYSRDCLKALYPMLDMTCSVMARYWYAVKAGAVRLYSIRPNGKTVIFSMSERDKE